jgi:histone-lysine N-methyltransferase SUV39H
MAGLFTDDESEGEQPECSRSVDRLFDDDDDDDDEAPTTANRSDAEAAMEVDALLAPRDRSQSSGIDDVTEALGSQKLKTSSPSEGSASRPNSSGPSASRPETPAATSEDPFDDFYASDSDDPLAPSNVPVQTPALAPSSASVSSRGSEPRTPPDTENLAVVPAATGKSYGGLAAITFDDWREGYQPLVRFTDEFLKGPELQSYINSFSAEYRMSGGTRQILSAHIAHNTREDEPNAPPIEILNKVDNDPAPPWEFWYTNQMYHGPGVPLPDGSKMKGCDCVGKCDPRSKTCQCVARQRVFFDGTDDHGLGFIYDKQRRLRPLLAGYAIWECNDLCGCDEDCMNRVSGLPSLCKIHVGFY